MRKMTSGLLALGSAILLTAPAWGVGGHKPPHTAKPGASKAAAAKPPASISSCAGCHGAKLQGGVGPNLQHEGTKRTMAWIVAQIKNPKVHTPTSSMPPASAFHLSAKDINALAAYLAKQK